MANKKMQPSWRRRFLTWQVNRANRLILVVILLNAGRPPMDDRNGFVADGYDRARDANEPIVRAEVESEFAVRLSNASTADQKRIRGEIEREIEKRLNALAPPDALY